MTEQDINQTTEETTVDVTETTAVEQPTENTRGGNRGGNKDGRDRRDNRRGNDRRKGDLTEAPKEFKEELIGVDRVTRVTAGGRQLRFRAVVVIGNGKGTVGL